MVKVKLFIAMSLDGYIASEDGSVDWLSAIENSEEDTSYDDFYKSIDSLIMGSTTYEQVVHDLSDIWPYPGIDSYILTSKDYRSYDSIHFVNQDTVEFIRSLKEERTKDIWIVGGPKIVNPLIEAGMIDEYIIAIIPVLLGKGIRLFTPQATQTNLKLVETYSRNQCVYVKYIKQ